MNVQFGFSAWKYMLVITIFFCLAAPAIAIAQTRATITFVGEADHVGPEAIVKFKSDGYDLFATMPSALQNFSFEGGGNTLAKLPPYVAGIQRLPGTYTYIPTANSHCSTTQRILAKLRILGSSQRMPLASRCQSLCSISWSVSTCERRSTSVSLPT